MWFLYIFVGIGPQCGGSSGGQTRSCALLCGHTSVGCIGGTTKQLAHHYTLMPFGHIHSGHRLVDRYVLRHISNMTFNLVPLWAVGAAEKKEIKSLQVSYF